ncbi:MAG: calcium/proton exchanger [Thermomicrobiales bacterium]|nr:calcium/proton exchanger [Thermomicrobiales bacterium]MCO5221321.1 calcium/proton exchanger [Thermomicrobiales bacterium]
MVQKILYGMLVLVPITIALHLLGIGGHTLIFVLSALSLIPLAGVLGTATEETAIYTGPKIGSLLNATLGNMAELIIAFAALREGLEGVVRASIAGSIIGNILIVLGASLFVGGLKNGIQTFDVREASTNATMMTLAVISLVVPGLFWLTDADGVRLDRHDAERLSDGVALIMLVIYAAYLYFTLFQKGASRSKVAHTEPATMSLPVAIGLLIAATIAVVVVSEILVGVIEPTAESWGLSEVFIGLIVVPLVGNIAEHLVAVKAAWNNDMDLSMGIALGSGLQVALFVAPVLVLLGELVNKPIPMIFNSWELIALIAAVLLAVAISQDGESNWLEGAQLIAVYLLLGTAFYFAG